MRRFAIPGLIVVVVAGLLAVLTVGISSQNDTSSIDAQVAAATSPRANAAGQPRATFPVAPDSTLSLPVLGSSQRMDLRAFRGRVVVLNVFASWCGPCAAEAPVLAREQRVLTRSDATLVGVTYEDVAPSSELFVRQHHVTYPVLRDVSGDFVRAFGTTGVPETFVIDRQGRIDALRRYQVTRQWLSRTLTPILRERS